MTGFGRSNGVAGLTAWHWEVRSVNGRGLDVRVRLPNGFEDVEPRLRESVARYFVRGSLTVTLVLKREEGNVAVRLNSAAFEQTIAAAGEAWALAREKLDGVEQPRIDGLLALKGVLEFVERKDSEVEAQSLANAILASSETALEAVVAARLEEGRRLAAVLLDRLADIERLLEVIGACEARRPEAIHERLAEQVGRLLKTTAAFDAARLHQEAVLLATRSDIAEELKRLQAHVAAARDLIAAGEPAGRRLDFLTQEFMREANTLCAKAYDGDITRAGLALKAVIDQMREQAQNIE
ncbi:MAG: YicC/YloC family endoribonuclease [Hyphomicrobiaceae bacterium]